MAAVFLLKIIFGIILWTIYTYHYTYRNTSDAFRFFDDATIIFNATKGNLRHFIQIISGINSEAEYLKPYLSETSHWYRPYDYGLLNDDRTLIRFNAIILLFSFGYYQVHIVFMNFFSLIGLVALYKTFASLLPDRKAEVFASVFFLPTVLFWGSGVLKEGLLMFALGLFIYALFILSQRNFSIKFFAVLLLSLFLLIITKLYVLICLLPALISMVVIKLSGQKRIALKFAITHILLILLALNLHHIHPDYNVLEILQIKQRDFYNVAELWNAGSLIDIGRLEPTPRSFITHIPQALSATFFRPHLIEADSVFLFASALENFIILALAVFYFFHLKKPGMPKMPWVLFCASFVIFLALLIGWTTPIMGAIVRYKLPLLPFLFFILFFISDKPKIISRFELWIKSF